VTAVVKFLKQLPEGEKALIFSEWDSLLDIVGKALIANHIGCGALLIYLHAQLLYAAPSHLVCIITNLPCPPPFVPLFAT
jgi:hypothetical protein